MNLERFFRGNPDVVWRNDLDDYSWLIWRHRYFSQCKNCRWTHRIWRGSSYVVHPISGWWERAWSVGTTLLCGCEHYDQLGTLLDEDDAFLTVCNRQEFRNRKLRIDYIVHSGFVKFYDEDDNSFCDDYAPTLGIYDIIAIPRTPPMRGSVTKE
jgi:hypothetical protein